MNKLTAKQEVFCLKYFELRNATEAAKIAGYAPRWVTYNITKLINNNSVAQRMEELKAAAQLTQSDTILTVNGRKERLSEIASEDNPGQYGLARGPNIAAIDTLNKMDKLYTDGAQFNIDNRKVEVIVNSEKAKDLTQRMLEGERTE